MITEIDNEVKLKPIKSENASLLFNIIDNNRVHLKEWLPWVSSTTKITDSTQFIKESHKQMKDGKKFITEIWYHNQLVGLVDLHSINFIHKKANIGYWLDGKQQGKGIMTKAVKAMINYGFTTLNLNRISVYINEKNVKSIAIPVRLNFVNEGLLRNFLIENGEPKNFYVYSIIREDWLKGCLA